ncbi:hypothetical protein ABZS87_36140, partial [Streptomyces sp. NPDC005336]
LNCWEYLGGTSLSFRTFITLRGPLSGNFRAPQGERQAYANDLDDPRALAAVTARENRQKADQDPREWLPSNPEARCRYITEWTAVKTRWRLSADDREATALEQLATACPDQELTVVLAR